MTEPTKRTVRVSVSVNKGSSVELSGAFSDPGADAHLVLIDWGDQSSSSGSTSSQGHLTGTHDYLLPGTYQITVTVTDSRGASGSASKVLTSRNATSPLGCTYRSQMFLYPQ